jgi:phosphatidylglycerol:prolipoprotein diacylglycerol transferase
MPPGDLAVLLPAVTPGAVPASIGSAFAARAVGRGPVHFATMIDFTPNPIALSVGPLEVRWYGLAYVAAIVAGTWMATREARRRGERTDVIMDGLIFVAIAALIGGRAYHVIDQWAYYQNHLSQIFLPPYSGLGIYGGLFTGMLAVLWYARSHHLSFWRWGDILAPSILIAQVFGRLGNFMNQELYGPPTNLPWGIAIQCQYRVAQYACPAGSDPNATLGQHFIPLFLYEALLSLLGIFVMLYLWRRFTAHHRILIAGDVGLLYFVWYGLERSYLETYRSGWDWTFNGIATAQLVGIGAAVAAIVTIFIRHWYVRRHPEGTASGVEGDPLTPSTVLAAAAPEPLEADPV